MEPHGAMPLDEDSPSRAEGPANQERTFSTHAMAPGAAAHACAASSVYPMASSSPLSQRTPLQTKTQLADARRPTSKASMEIVPA